VRPQGLTLLLPLLKRGSGASMQGQALSSSTSSIEYPVNMNVVLNEDI